MGSPRDAVVGVNRILSFDNEGSAPSRGNSACLFSCFFGKAFCHGIGSTCQPVCSVIFVVVTVTSGLWFKVFFFLVVVC